ncbi:MAG: ATP-binding protein, partial [Vulcanibacillus sp.]
MELKKFRISARLLSMIGSKLIEDGKVALTELIKNAYDADATQVVVDYVNFGVEQEISQNNSSKLIIVDNGHGMTNSVINNSFLNIATSMKHSVNGVRSSPKGRVFLGSHGIGRFALLKLGKKITIITKSNGDDYYKLIWDFSLYDDDFIDNDSQSDLGLNDIKIKFLSTSKKELSLYTNHDTGTVIIIENLTDKWTLNNIKDFAVDITTFS